MATESIFTNINITDPKKAETFIKALEEAERIAEKFEPKQNVSVPPEEDIKEFIDNIVI